MTKKELLMDVLERMGYKPEYDNDGDILLRYQLKHIYFITREEDEDNFVLVQLPKFDEFKEEDTTLHLAACNKVTRGIKMVKVYVDKSLNEVSASCEFFYANEEALKLNIEKALRILGLVRTSYRNCLKELTV